MDGMLSAWCMTRFVIRCTRVFVVKEPRVTTDRSELETILICETH